MTETTRIAKWDNIRLVLIFCVVLGHVINYVRMDTDSMNRVYLYIYAFHMPAFVFLSGMFSQNAVKHYRYDKAFTFLLLYFVIKFSLFLTRVAVGKEAAFHMTSTVGIDWYALAIFLFYLVTMFLQRFDKRYLVPAVIFFGCMASYDLSLGGKLVLARATAFYPFFLLGFCVNRDTLFRISKVIPLKLAALVFLIAMGWVAAVHYDDLEWLMPLLKGFSYRNLDDDLFYFGGLLRLGCYAVALLMTLAVIVVVPAFKGFWSRFGSRTMGVYAFHYCLITAVMSGWDVKKLMIKKMTEAEANQWMVILSLAIVLVLSLKPVDWLIRRLTVPPLRKAVGKDTAAAASPASEPPQDTPPEATQPLRREEEDPEATRPLDPIEEEDP